MYIIKKTENNIDSIFDKVWDTANVANIDKVNWEGYGDIPKTTAKLLYNDYGIYVQFETDEKPLIAKCTEHNDDVFYDSCMEFFIRPCESDSRYLNFEFNPLGTMYFAIRTSRHDWQEQVEDNSYFDVKSYIDAKKWILQFCIPFEYVDGFFGGHSDTMYGNLFKCCENESKTHFATYYPIKADTPEFHKPECFGKFVLE